VHSGYFRRDFSPQEAAHPSLFLFALQEEKRLGLR
jgi:hypothetical protein